MLRIHLLQNWFSLSDPVMEEALYEIMPIRQRAPHAEYADGSSCASTKTQKRQNDWKVTLIATRLGQGCACAFNC
jgi:IS5 family transposase